jgi:hypothetical protein
VTRSRPSATSDARLDALIEEATVDCYNEDEQVTGLFTMIEDSLTVPFQTSVLGISVTIASVELTDNNQIVAICHRDGLRSRSRSSICHCQRRHPMARNGSRHTVAGSARSGITTVAAQSLTHTL